MMKRPRFLSVLPLALAALCVAGTAYSGSGPSATGGGSTMAPPFGRVSFGFAAVTHKNGTVTGHFEARSPSTDTFATADVQCLDVQGNTASFGGFVHEGSFLGTDLAGLCYVAAAQDNGQGKKSPPDLVSFITFGLCTAQPPDSACSGLVPLTVLEVQGNVKVRP